MPKRFLLILMLLLPSISKAEIDESIVKCLGHEVLLTARGDIAVVDKASNVRIYLAILHDNQLLQNDDRGLNLTGTKKRMGMILSRKKLFIDYKTGAGFFEETNVAGTQANKKVALKSCKRSS